MQTMTFDSTKWAGASLITSEELLLCSAWAGHMVKAKDTFLWAPEQSH